MIEVNTWHRKGIILPGHLLLACLTAGYCHRYLIGKVDQLRVLKEVVRVELFLTSHDSCRIHTQERVSQL